MSASLAAFLYLIAGALFIMALRGLSSPESSRQGNLFGMIGMGLAIVTTLLLAAPASGLAWVLIISGIAIGGAIGAGAIASGSTLAMIFGFLALILASVNIFGGFLVTQRMLGMYKKKA